MPPPLPPLQQRRPTRPRALRRKIFSRSSDAARISDLESGLDAIIASGQATRTTRGKKMPPPITDPEAGPSAEAGEAKFAASPLTLSPHPSPAQPSFASAPPTAPTQTPIPAVRTRTPQPPRYPAPVPNIGVGRFPSPPKARGGRPRATAAPAPPDMPPLSPSSPMEVGPSGPATRQYATVAKQGTAPMGATPPTATATTTNTATAANKAADAANAPNAPKTPKPATRYPPLIVEVLPDWPTHFKELKRVLGHTPNGRPFGKGVRFIPKTDQEFRLTQRYLTQLESETGISWFCYSLPAERSVKVAIRGLPANTEPALVEKELRELGYTPEHVRAIPARPGRPGCLMFAQLQRTPTLLPGIYEVRELLCMPGITIESWRGRKGSAQCHRCQ